METSEGTIDHFGPEDTPLSLSEDVPFLEKVLASEQITHSVMTPCDETEYCQVLQDEQNPEIIITVQTWFRNVKQKPNDPISFTH